MLRILDYPWHQAHLYRLLALPAIFTLAETRKPIWNLAQRPMTSNLTSSVPPEEVIAGDYDLALLHLDHWCDRITSRAYAFRLMKAKTMGTKQVVIIHSTPDDDRNRRAILQLVEDLPVVCNSEEAARAWDGEEKREDRYGLPQFRAIIHGYQVGEFYSYPLENREQGCFTVCSGGYLSEEYHGLPIIKRMMRDIPLLWYGPSGNRAWLPDYESYRDMLARSLIYFSATRRGPMPGARTEAMLSGCCIVSVPGNDVERYIEHGVNGFIVRTYEEAVMIIESLLDHPERAYEVGQLGRETAQSEFNHHRFTRDWLRLFQEVGVL